MRLLSSATCLALLATAPASTHTTTAGPVFAPLVNRLVPMADGPPAPRPTRAAKPVSDAQVDRLIRVLPDEKRFKIEPRGNEEQLARLQGLNPGHEQEVRTIVMTEVACLGAASRQATLRMLRTAAGNLGPEKLGRLIAFYEGPDSRTFARIWDDVSKRQQLSEAEIKEMTRLIFAYPLQDWQEALERSTFLLRDDRTYREAVARCGSERQAKLTSANLRSGDLGRNVARPYQEAIASRGRERQAKLSGVKLRSELVRKNVAEPGGSESE